MAQTLSISTQFESRLEDINKFINDIADRETPFLKMFLDLSNPVDNPKHEWVNRSLRGFEDSLVVAISSTTQTIITVNGGTDTPKAYYDGVTQIRMGTEVMLVTSTTTVVSNYRRLVITRGYLSTTPSTYLAAAKLRIVGGPRAEGFDADRDDSEKGVRAYNYSQIFEKQLKISGTALKTNMVENEAEMNRQGALKMKELMKELEVSLLNNVTRYADSNIDNRVAGGFPYWAITAAGNNQDFGGSAISFGLLEDKIEQYKQNGGDTNKLCMVVPVRQQRKLNELKETRVVQGGMNQSENKISNYWNVYDFGTTAQVQIYFTNDLFDDEIYFFQKDKIKVRPYAGRQMHHEDLAKVGDSQRELLVGEYTFEFFNPKETLYRVSNLSTSV